jgi:hypothetical protein
VAALNSKVRRSRPLRRDYSQRLLVDKLGVKPGHRVAVLGVEGAEFLQDLAARVSDYSRGERISNADLIFFFAEVVKDLSQLKSLSQAIQKNGAVWVIYPKGRAHLDRGDVIAGGKAAGLVDNKICRFSDTHTALRSRQAVIRSRHHRGKHLDSVPLT